MLRRPLFRRKANRLCVFVSPYGFIPIASELDDKPEFVTGEPRRIGDDCILFVEGKYRMARLLPTSGGGSVLVDMGPARRR